MWWIYSLISAGTISFRSLLNRGLLDAHPLLLVALWTRVVLVAALVPLAFLLASAPRLPSLEIALLCLGSASLGLLSTLLGLSGLTRTTHGQGGAFYTLAPLLQAAVGSLWMGEAITPLAAAGLVLGALGGVLLVRRCPWSAAGPLLASTVLLAVCGLADRQAALSGFPTLWWSVYLHLAILAGLYLLQRLRTGACPLPPSAAHGPLLGMAGLGAISTSAYCLALPLAPIAYIASLKRLEALGGLVLGWRYRCERLSARLVAACLLLLCGGALTVLGG